LKKISGKIASPLNEVDQCPFERRLLFGENMVGRHADENASGNAHDPQARDRTGHNPEFLPLS
jgi:hypothetical protein